MQIFEEWIPSVTNLTDESLGRPTLILIPHKNAEKRPARYGPVVRAETRLIYVKPFSHSLQVTEE
jgi:hypothetical protein